MPSSRMAIDGTRHRQCGHWTASSAPSEIPFVVPPLSEQATIVRFLDHADRRIRRYIRTKQKLIKLLEEQKQAIIHRAVTRGLDPNVRLKPSGVEWLGDVPEHWEVRRVKRVRSQMITAGRLDDVEARVSPLTANVRGVLPHPDVGSVPIAANVDDGLRECRPGQESWTRCKRGLSAVYRSSVTSLPSGDCGSRLRGAIPR